MDDHAIKFGRHGVMGCPWHGLVEGGQLALPNGASMSYPQPTGYAWQCGAAALIAHPGAPEVVRDTAAQAADAAAGRQWRNKAVLAGLAQLHGVDIGQGSWIYIDPAGDRWLVSTTLHGATATATTATITLKRFGVLGGAPLEVVHSVTLPDMGQATPDIGKPLSALEISAYHTSPTGSGALFMIGWRYPSATAYDLRPVGWLEVLISGPGAACSITVEVRKTREQTLGSVGIVEQEPQDTGAWMYVALSVAVVDDSQGSPVCSGTITTTSTPSLTFSEVGEAGSQRVEVRQGTQVVEWDGYLIALWYAPGGAISELSLSQHWQAAYNLPSVTAGAATNRVRVDTLSGGPGACDFSSQQTSEWQLNVTRSASVDTTLTMRYHLDGVEMGSTSISTSESTTQAQTLRGDGADSWTTNRALTCTPGGSLNDGASGSGHALNFTGPASGFDVTGDLVDRLFPGVSYLAGWVWADGIGYMTTYPARYSPQLFGWVELKGQLSTGALEPHYSAAVSPSGGAVVASIELPAISASFYPPLYGSWCPLTGQTARSVNPICWV